MNKKLMPKKQSGSDIKIKKSHLGLFTEYCGGKVTQECIDKAKKSGNKKLVKRAIFALNSRLWKYQTGGSTKRIDFKKLQNDAEYQKNYGWRMDNPNLELLQDSLIARNATYPQRIAVFSQVIPENGGSPKPHGNGAFGILGWRGSRAVNLPEDAPGQINKLMTDIYDNPKAKDWTHGGKGTGVQTGKEMMNLFLNTPNVIQAAKAFMKGHVIPEVSEWAKRLNFAEFLKKFAE